MSAGLSTHVLDTARGKPAGDVRLELFAVGQERTKLSEAVTNPDGRTDAPLIARGELRPGTYELVFHIGPYFAGFPGVTDPPFYDAITLRFSVTDTAAHYHVPLAVSPWAYSTYRGS